MSGEGWLATRWQHAAVKQVVRVAAKQPGEVLTADDWLAYFDSAGLPASRVLKRVFRTLPASPRCGFCGAPFAGFGSRVVRPFGYRPSAKNPNMCSTCLESSPPGGVNVELGVLFADLRGFTTLSERVGPTAARAVLQRFYATAEDVFFPEAVIDKVIGDAVMALYIPALVAATGGTHRQVGPADVAGLMVEHARELVRRLNEVAPDVRVGVGLGLGEAFFGHVGQGAVHDFTAVGDVVNTASRLQSAAAPGEVVLAARVAELLPALPGVRETITVKGKDEPLTIHRIGVV